ncbi:MAG: hypothetical protein ACK56Q_01790, partial [Pirellulaceae bacterium]
RDGMGCIKSDHPDSNDWHRGLLLIGRDRFLGDCWRCRGKNQGSEPAETMVDELLRVEEWMEAGGEGHWGNLLICRKIKHRGTQ